MERRDVTERVGPSEVGYPIEEPVLFVGRSPEEHGVLREISCGAPRPVMCRLCHGEKDCPYVSARSPLRIRVTYRAPTDPVPPLEHRTVRTGCDGGLPHGRRAACLVLPALLAWSVAASLVLWFWVLHRPPVGELVALVAFKATVFVLVVVGIPLVRLTWSHHGGRFRRSP